MKMTSLRKWKSKSQIYIKCDICEAKILKTRKNRKRCNNDGESDTECQKEAMRRKVRSGRATIREKKAKRYIKCDICLKPILQTRRNLKRCYGERGKPSNCQKEAMRRYSRGESSLVITQPIVIKNGCLKCGKKFKGGLYNRICSNCTRENQYYKLAIL